MNDWLPAAVVLSSGVPGVVIFLLGEERHLARTALNLAGAVVKVVLVGLMLDGVARGEEYEVAYAILPGYDLSLRADALGLLFVSLSAVLWLLTTVYAIGYLARKPHRSRFFGFFGLCVSATTGIALAGNPLTFLLFYETLTLSTYPLVVHHGDPESLAVGRKYLAYTLTGGALLFLAILWSHALVGPYEFTEGGALPPLGLRTELRALFALFIAALGVKTALVPLHAWLPAAMVAPAPVSALLHAVAVVKAGAFGIVRVVYEVFGVEFSQDLGLLVPLAIAASVTILYGSIRALAECDLKRRLAYSTVSQVSYIVLGASLFGPLGTLGGLAHLVHQGLMKITLFFCAGIYAEALGVHRVSELDGIGRRLPLATAAFTVGALGMIGLPPLAGFVSKWTLGLGAIAAGQPWAVAVLAASTLLNALYFLPILYRAWFRQRRAPWPEEVIPGRAVSLWLLAPAVATAALTIAVGLFAATAWSVLSWAGLIVEREYVR